MSKNTAIIIFTRTANDEAKHKHFVKFGNKRANALVAGSLIKHAVHTVKQTGIPYFVITSEKQEGGTFGDRLGSAMMHVFSAGFERIIAIGNDCPDITPSVLVKAEQQLEEHDLVAGPTFDGGVYLIGVTKKAYLTLDLEHAVQWQGSAMLSSLIAHIACTGSSCYYLATKSDIDFETDVFRFLSRHSYYFQLEAEIRGVLASLKKALLDYNFVYLSIRAKGILSLRAPPLRF